MIEQTSRENLSKVLCTITTCQHLCSSILGFYKLLLPLRMRVITSQRPGSVRSTCMRLLARLRRLEGGHRFPKEYTDYNALTRYSVANSGKFQAALVLLADPESATGSGDIAGLRGTTREQHEPSLVQQQAPMDVDEVCFERCNPRESHKTA
jgi:hypothetical protein